jgi:hypothetical protein
VQRAVRNEGWFAAGLVHAGVILVWACAFLIGLRL